MKKLTLALGGVVLVMALIFFGSVAGALFGALSGWIVSFFFVTTCAKLVAITGFKVYQLGAIVGFVGGFFRHTFNNRQNAE